MPPQIPRKRLASPKLADYFRRSVSTSIGSAPENIVLADNTDFEENGILIRLP
jgi:hypothetical protein